MSTRIFIRIVVPSSYMVVSKKISRLIATSTHKNSKKNAISHVSSSSFIPNSHENRLYSQQIPVAEGDNTMTVDYDYVKKSLANLNILIIDVREPEEVKEHGKIPNSINIPLANVLPVLSQVSDSEFKELYERSKPTENTEMIFYCMIGKRSGKAQANALSLGFKKFYSCEGLYNGLRCCINDDTTLYDFAKNYLGSWTDWASKTQ